MDLSAENTTILTNSAKTIVGIDGKEWFKGPPRRILFCFNTSFEVESKSLQAVVNIEELNVIENNVCSEVINLSKSIDDQKIDISLCEEKIKEIKKLKLVKSENPVGHYINKAKNNEERGVGEGTFNGDVKISGNDVVIPSRLEHYVYNSNDGLTTFNIGDVVAVTFGTGSKVAKQYKGKTVDFVVNNCKRCDWCYIKCNRLALIPVKDGWSKKDIVLVDSYRRFESLIDGLYPCNRVSYKGWQTKTVGLKRIYVTDKMPKVRKQKRVMREIDFTEVCNDDTWVFIGGTIWDNSFHISGIGKGRHRNCRIIYTTKDRDVAIEWLNRRIEYFKECISDMNDRINKIADMIDGLKRIRELNLVKE